MLSLLPKIETKIQQIGDDNGSLELDLFVIGNPMLDISVYETDDALLKKYNIEKGS